MKDRAHPWITRNRPQPEAEDVFGRYMAGRGVTRKGNYFVLSRNGVTEACVPVETDEPARLVNLG